MSDNSMKEAVSCPVRGFSPADMNMFSNEGQNNSSQSDEKKEQDSNGFGNKESGGGLALPNLSLMLPKRFDDQQDSQDGLPAPDLHNGHNNPEAIDIKHRNKSLGELLDESEDLPDTDLMGCSKEYSSKEGDEKLDSKNSDIDNVTSDLNKERSSQTQENSEEEKDQQGDSGSQDIFEDSDSKENSKQSNKKIETTNTSDNQDMQFSEGFDLHLSETQTFLSSEKENAVTVSDSDDSNAIEDESNDKVCKVNDEKNTDDVEASVNTGSNLEAPISNDSADVTFKKSNDTEQELDKEEVSNESDKLREENLEETKPESESIDSNKDGTEGPKKEEIKVQDGDKDSSDGKAPGVDNASEEKCEVSAKTEGGAVPAEEGMDIPEPNAGEAGSEDNGTEGDEQEEDELVEDSKEERKEEAKAGDERRPQRKRQTKKGEKDTVEIIDKKAEPMEIEESSDLSEISVPCSCEPRCHKRIDTVSTYLDSACSQLEAFIKLKRRDDNKALKNLLDMMKEIHSICQNEPVTEPTKIGEHILIPEETPPKRKSGIKRKSTDVETPLKETPRKRSNTEEKSPKKSEKKPNIEFKDLKGLAVFAKWPNSGWYYPGKVEELSGSDWKEASNVTVKFYDGLVREMKNINILPAYLIPPGSMLSDLDDETEMVVISCDGSNQNSVDFKLATKDNSGRDFEMNFNKLAIRANHMKTIKQQLEPTTDVVPKKMHMVSLDNLVSGRRSRGRSKKDIDSEEKAPTNQTERRSTGSSSFAPSRKSATPKRARN